MTLSRLMPMSEWFQIFGSRRMLSHLGAIDDEKQADEKNDGHQGRVDREDLDSKPQKLDDFPKSFRRETPGNTTENHQGQILEKKGGANC